MNKQLLALIVALLLAPAPVSAGKIAEVFSGDIFGVKWGSNQQQVSKVFPKGKIKKMYDLHFSKVAPKGKSKKMYGTHFYTVQDGRTLFGIKRNPDNTIKFVFNAEGKMNGVIIEFPNGVDGFGILLNKLNTYFGPHTFDPNRESMVIEWPEDSGIKISLMGVFFNILYIKTESSVTKEELRF
jgi:hypothetical protein